MTGPTPDPLLEELRVALAQIEAHREGGDPADRSALMFSERQVGPLFAGAVARIEEQAGLLQESDVSLAEALARIEALQEHESAEQRLEDHAARRR